MAGDQLTVELNRSGGTGSTATIRTHSLTMDRPEAKGGTDTGPMGGEAFLAALGGCFMSTLVAAAEARSIPVDDASCTVTGEFVPNPTRFGSAHLEVSCASCPPEQLAHLVQVAERGCLVAATLRQGMEITAKAV